MFQVTLAASDPISTLLDLLTNPQYEPLRTALREIGGFLAGVASTIGGRRGIQDVIHRLRPAPQRPNTPPSSDIEAQQGFNRWLMAENARLNLALSAKNRENDSLEQANARLTGVNETLRAIVNDDELPAHDQSNPPLASD